MVCDGYCASQMRAKSLLLIIFLFIDFDKILGKYYYSTFTCVAAALDVLIDSLKFSREGQTVSGSLPIGGFGRLRDSLWPAAFCSDSVDYKVSGGADVRGRPVLRLLVTGWLPLQCQRCLGERAYELAIDATLRLVPEALLDAEQSDDPGEPDCIAASLELDLPVLIEDEILLALPAYPRHADDSCSETHGKASVKSENVSAFGALSILNVLQQKEFKSKE